MRRLREMYEMTEVRKDMNRMKFFEHEEEVNGRGYGQFSSGKMVARKQRILKNKQLNDMNKKGTLTSLLGTTTSIGNGSTTSVNINNNGMTIFDPLHQKN